VDRLTFDEIVGIIAPFMRERSERKARYSSGSVMSNRARLAVTLCWLAKVSYLIFVLPRGVLAAPFSVESSWFQIALRSHRGWISVGH